MHLIGRGVVAGPALHQRGEVGIVIRRLGQRVHVEQVLGDEDLALACLGQDDEFMAEVAADGPGVGAHRDGLQPHAREGAQIGHEHLVVGMARAFLGQVEGIGVLHQEFAAAHHAEARAHLVPELPLDVVEVARQVAVALGELPEDIGDHFLVGRAEQHLAIMPVLEAQHLRPIGVVAAGLAPEIGRLDGGHQDFLRAGAVLFLAHDLADLLQCAPAHGQPGIDAGRGLADEARAQHQPVRDDLRLGGRFLERGQEGARQAQGSAPGGMESGRNLAQRRAKRNRCELCARPGARGAIALRRTAKRPFTFRRHVIKLRAPEARNNVARPQAWLGAKKTFAFQNCGGTKKTGRIHTGAARV